MNAYVFVEVSALGESLLTVPAREWFLPVVNTHVFREVAATRETFVALSARVQLRRFSIGLMGYFSLY